MGLLVDQLPRAVAERELVVFAAAGQVGAASGAGLLSGSSPAKRA